jgi:hypothetical protein
VLRLIHRAEIDTSIYFLDQNHQALFFVLPSSLLSGSTSFSCFSEDLFALPRRRRFHGFSSTSCRARGKYGSGSGGGVVVIVVSVLELPSAGVVSMIHVIFVEPSAKRSVVMVSL